MSDYVDLLQQVLCLRHRFVTDGRWERWEQAQEWKKSWIEVKSIHKIFQKEGEMAFWRLYYHLVWATKKREPFIQPNIESHLYSYLVHKAGELDVFVYQVNGWQDHVHLIAAIPPKISISDVVKNLKGASSHFINDRNFLDEYFSWQRGYGILSLGEKQRPFAEEYVLNQKLHHEQNSINSWLERIDDVDEGPMFSGEDGQILHEPGEKYRVGDEFPF